MMKNRMQNRMGRYHAGFGFSLIEVLIAAAMFSIGMVGIMSLFPAALIESQNAKNNAIAATVGQNALEYLKLRGFRPNPHMDGRFSVYIPGADRNENKWFSTSGTGAASAFSAMAFPDEAPTFQTVNRFASAGDTYLIKPCLLNLGEMLYWPTGPTINVLSPPASMHRANFDKASIARNVPRAISVSHELVDGYQSPSVCWTFGYYRKNRNSPTQIYVFVYDTVGMELTVDSGVQDTPGGNLFDAKKLDGLKNLVIRSGDFPVFTLANDLSLKEASGANNMERLLKKGQVLLHPDTGTILNIRANWNPEITNDDEQFRQLLDKKDYEKLTRFLVTGQAPVLIGFPVPAGNAIGIKPLGIFVGTLEE